MKSLIHSPPKSALASSHVEGLRPKNADELHRWVKLTTGVNVVRKAIVPGNDAPFDYLRAAFFERNAGDLVVWASRGGGKTMLGAIATLLDLAYKPGIQIRILGGSLAQSQRMYEHLRSMIGHEFFRPLLAQEPTERQITLVSGSTVRLLSQSPTSVRGEHVHKLRCDEVDEFDPAVWAAAQLATRSGRCGQTMVRGRIEAISTMHHAYGPMSKLIERARRADSPANQGEINHAKAAPEPPRTRILRWSAMDVIERCPAERPCEGCALWNHCEGRAKNATGYIAVDDMLRLHARSSDDSWSAEMMCLRPRREALVYRRFDPTPGGKHVMISPRVLPTPLPLREGPGEGRVHTLHFGRNQALSRPSPNPSIGGRGIGFAQGAPDPIIIGGMDFGMRDPFVMLWARLIPPVDGSPRPRAEDWTIEVIGELHEKDLTMEQAADKMESMGLPKPKWIGIDPAGGQTNRQTGISDAEYLRRRGYRTISQGSRIAQGIEIIRRRLDRGTLRVDAGCKELIRSLREYHFDAEDERKETPVKDGADHACDALRYMVVGLEFNSWGTEFGSW